MTTSTKVSLSDVSQLGPAQQAALAVLLGLPAQSSAPAVDKSFASTGSVVGLPQ